MIRINLNPGNIRLASGCNICDNYQIRRVEGHCYNRNNYIVAGLVKKSVKYKISEQENVKVSTCYSESQGIPDKVVHVHWHKHWPCLKMADLTDCNKQHLQQRKNQELHL